MIEKIKVSLWDIFTFFLTGLLSLLVATVLLVHIGKFAAEDIVSRSLSIPASVSLVALPVLLTLLGLLVEPLANYSDRLFLARLVKAIRGSASGDPDEIVLREEIATRYLGTLGNKLKNPYQLCKDYVEYKQLSTTFMVFLARFGFYRNVAFISMVSGFLALAVAERFLAGLASLGLGLILAIIFRLRAEDFYSYQAPTIYRAFLIDRFFWSQPQVGAVEESN